MLRSPGGSAVCSAAGLDLCLRLRERKQRHLFVRRVMKVAEEIGSVGQAGTAERFARTDTNVNAQALKVVSTHPALTNALIFRGSWHPATRRI